jgi:hypothetical protein
VAGSQPTRHGLPLSSSSRLAAQLVSRRGLHNGCC